MYLKRLFEKIENADAFLIISPTNREYFTSFKSSFGMLFITQDKKYYATDSRYEIAAKEMLGSKFEIIIGNKEDCIKAIVEKAKEHCVNFIAVEDEYLTHSEYEKIQADFRAFNIVPCGDSIMKMRAIKTDDEIANIAKSQKIASDAFLKILLEIKIGVSEIDIAIELEYIIKKMGGECMSFETVVASGVNSAKPHARPTLKKIAQNDIILLDYGTKVNGYCSDITRTVCMGKGNTTFRHIYDITLKSGCYAIDNVKAGMSAKEADSYAREYIIANSFGKEFNHSLGHGVGLDIHELPTVSPNSHDILEENMVITIEPGIYMPNVGGVRIEDLVVVKKDGVVNLTTADKAMIIL